MNLVERQYQLAVALILFMIFWFVSPDILDRLGLSFTPE